MIRAYELLTRALYLALDVTVRLPRSRKHRERLGRIDAAILDRLRGRPTIWVHNASVGELLAAVPLVRGLRQRHPDHAIVLSTTSFTGRDIARRIAEADAAFLLPLDAPPAVERVIAEIRPVLFVFTETEIWPCLLAALGRRGVPAVLLSGRISPRAFARYRWIRGLLGEALGHVRLFGMQNDAEAERIRALGAPAGRVVVIGSLKLDSVPPPARLTIGGDGPLWVAGSTHEGEEAVCIEVFGRLRQRFPRLRLLLAPRHLERLGQVEELLERSRQPFRRRSDVEGAWNGSPGLLVLDTLGELSGLYRHAAVAFVGGTLVPVGGHNLLEPARAGVPVLFGPHVENVVDAARALEESGGGRKVRTAKELEAELERLLADDVRRHQAGRAAAATFPPGEVTARSLDALERCLRGEAA